MKDIVSETNQYRIIVDLAEYLVESMELSGISREAARNWVQTRLRCQPETVTTVKVKARPACPRALT